MITTSKKERQEVIVRNNQESRWPEGRNTSVAFLVAIVIIIVTPLTYFNLQSKKVVVPARAEGVAQNNTPSVTPTTTPPVDKSEGVKSSEVSTQQEEIDAYIRTIFGKDAKVAIAVNRVECNPGNKKYPKCVYHTDHEYSVGIFQINLFNKSHWIHAKKVPGKTMEEKIENLKDPYLNTLIAYKIFTDSGFEPWAGYTSGRYLDHLGN